MLIVGMKGRGNSYKTVVMETWGKTRMLRNPKRKYVDTETGRIGGGLSASGRLYNETLFVFSYIMIKFIIVIIIIVTTTIMMFVCYWPSYSLLCNFSNKSIRVTN